MADENRYRTVTMTEEAFHRYDRLRQRKAKLMGITNLSWQQFFSAVEEGLRESVKQEEESKANIRRIP